MFGKRLTKPVLLTAPADRDPAGKIDLGQGPWDIEAGGHAAVSASPSSYRISVFIDATAAADDVCLVDGRMPIGAGILAEHFGNVVLAGEARWINDLAAIGGPFHIVRHSTAVADVLNVPVRYSVELDQKAT